MTRSWTSGPTLVAPQAIRALCPRTTPGTPGNETPATSYGQAASTVRQCNPFMYQIDGIELPRCGSFASSAPPVTDSDGATTQLFEPIPWSEASPPASSRPATWSAVWPSRATEAQAAACVALSDATADGATGAEAASLGERPEPVVRFDPGCPDGVITGAPSR